MGDGQERDGGNRRARTGVRTPTSRVVSYPGYPGSGVRFLPAPTSTRDYQADLSRLAPAWASQEPS